MAPSPELTIDVNRTDAHSRAGSVQDTLRQVKILRHHKEIIMKLSARNALPGTVESVTKGATTTTVKIDVGGGNHITSSITNNAAEDLGLKAGDKVTAIIKASDVIIGK
jgi:molybdopterin-binding protein